MCKATSYSKLFEFKISFFLLIEAEDINLLPLFQNEVGGIHVFDDTYELRIMKHL